MTRLLPSPCCRPSTPFSAGALLGLPAAVRPCFAREPDRYVGMEGALAVSMGSGAVGPKVLPSSPIVAPSALQDGDSLPSEAELRALAPLARVTSFEAFSRMALPPKLRSLHLVQRFASLLRLRSQVKTSPQTLPRIAAISDIHGNAMRLLDLMKSDAFRQADRVIFLGDYFDRDGDGLDVFRLLRARTQRGGDIFLMGNHEMHFQLAMKGDLISFRHWISYGGLPLLAKVLDLGELRQAYRAMRKQYDFLTDDFFVDKMMGTNPFLFEDLRKHMRADPTLQEISAWISANCRLVHVDEYGMLYIHAGIRPDLVKGMLFADELEAHQRAFMRVMHQGSHVQTCALADKLNPFLEMREREWLRPMQRQGERAFAVQLFALGIRGVIYGHTQRFNVTTTCDRCFGIDLSMAECLGGLGGVLLTGPNGMQLHHFAERDAGELNVRWLLKGRHFRRMLAADTDQVLQRFQTYFQQMA